MNTILQQRIEEAAENHEEYYNVGEEHGYLYTHKGDIKGAVIYGATFALQNQWIGVEDELPTEKVIIAKLSKGFCGKDNCYEILHRIAKEHIDLRHPDGYYDSCGENVPTSAITHWAPIPEMKGGEK